MNRITSGVLAGLMLASGLVGCTSAQSADPGWTSPATSEAVDLATRSGGWPKTEEELQNAANRLDERCLREAGFAVPTAPAVRLPAPEDEKAAIALGQRSNLGYGIATPAHESTASAVETYVQTLSHPEQIRYRAAQFGSGAPRTTIVLIPPAKVQVADGGCVATGRRSLAGDLRTWARLDYIPDQLDSQLSAQAMKVPRYKAALASWRACLKARSFDFPSPEAAQTALRKEYARIGPSRRFKRREIAVAVADGECAQKAHLPTVLLAARRSLVEHLPSSELSSLRSLCTKRHTALARARKTLGMDKSG
ncbi:hypothetical protein [Streptomyces mirabilis]|uniref:hypothetical protein n=1 Tax=Streptomyces mirabilis TaxID=68239 RepID=UPI0036A44225